MRLVAYGHFGRPVIGFPSGGEFDEEEWEYEQSGVIRALEDGLSRGELKLYTVTAIDRDSFLNSSISPSERSFRQKLYDEYIMREVIPFIREDCQTPDIMIKTVGPSIGAYHSVNTLLKHPDTVEACYALSGVFDLREYMDGELCDDLYFNNPPDYLPNIRDEALLGSLRRCRVRLVTSNNQEDPRPSYALHELLVAKGIDSVVDNWGLEGGKKWSCWAAQMRKFLVEQPNA